MNREVPQVAVDIKSETKRVMSVLSAEARDRIAKACVKAFGCEKKAREFANTQ